MVHQKSEPRIIAIGASAGGIEALQVLLQAMAKPPGAAIVVVQHRNPGIGTLHELLATWSHMPAQLAVDGLRPVRDHVYLAEPDRVLTLERGTFRTRPVEKLPRHPAIETIDALFESIASDRKAHAIAVVLSGTGSDGTAGAICVKQAGGIVYVQDPLTATQGDMPQSVIDRRAFDRVLSPAEIATQLSNLDDVVPGPYADEILAFTEIVALIRTYSGTDLSKYKSTPLLWRIEYRMRLRRSSSIEGYAALLRDDPAELDVLIRSLPIYTAELFRDAAAWTALGLDVIVPLVAEREQPIRAWTPSCATGEEAYSLAMLLAEHTSEFQTFATDVSSAIVGTASTGVFSATAVEQLSEQRRSRFFYPVDGAYRVKRSLREHMVFGPHDLLSDPPFATLDLVTCRNLLRYLGPQASERVIAVLHAALRPGGYLFLGNSEVLPPEAGFEAVSLPWRIYRKAGENKTDAAPTSRPLAASREELHAVNGELRASNDQLNIANHDLTRANLHLSEKLEELEMQGRVLSSGGVATLFLDGELRIRWFTPAACELFPLMPQDTGRRISDLVPRFGDPAFFDDVAAVIASGNSREAEVRSQARWFLRRISPHRRGAEIDGVAVTFTNITDGRNVSNALRASEAELRGGEAWIAGQQEAFQAAIDGAPLEASLGILGHTAITQLGSGVRCGFYVLGDDGASLHHVVGMPASYADRIGGPESVALHAGEPVITPDVREEPRWRDWLALAAEHDVRGCWSLPIETATGTILGTLAIYHREPRDATNRDLRFCGVLTRATAVIISRHREMPLAVRPLEA